jgi:REP element-mobilizing transposase RayT
VHLPNHASRDAKSGSIQEARDAKPGSERAARDAKPTPVRENGITWSCPTVGGRRDALAAGWGSFGRGDAMTGHRRSIRLGGFDYGQPGAWFVTICAWERQPIFGSIAKGQVNRSLLGEIAEQCWTAIPEHVPSADLDAFVVMPNHLHGILVIGANLPPTASRPAATEAFAAPRAGTLPTIVRSFKAAVSREARQSGIMAGEAVWQRNYFERAIRNERELERFRAYIEANPARWEDDEEHPEFRRPRR